MINPFNVVANFVESAVTALTGSEALGDIASMAVNITTGNYIGVAEDAVDLLSGDQGGETLADMAEHVARPALADHPAAACPAWDNSVHVDVDVTVPTDGGRATHTHRYDGAEVEVDIRIGWGEIPAAPREVRDSLASKLNEILNNPSLSLEDKIALLFGELLGGLDEEIEGTMDTLQQKQAAKERSESGAKGKPANGGEEVSAADISRLSSELQILMQHRSQMQSLLSNIMGMSHQSAMQTISNIR